MAMRTHFIIHPGISAPSAWQPVAVPLLTMQEIWEAARIAPQSLIFRVRSEKDPGSHLGPGDRLESCVGVVDASTRWRVVFALTRAPLNALQHPQLRQACHQAMAWFAGTHPAAVTVDQRSQIIAGIAQAGTPDPEDEKAAKPNPVEQHIALGVMGLLHAENDIEAAHRVPFLSALVPFSEEKERQRFAERMATVETMTGSILLSEAYNRLAERAPAWMFTPMPDLGAKGSEKEDDGDREDEEE